MSLSAFAANAHQVWKRFHHKCSNDSAFLFCSHASGSMEEQQRILKTIPNYYRWICWVTILLHSDIPFWKDETRRKEKLLSKCRNMCNWYRETRSNWTPQQKGHTQGSFGVGKLGNSPSLENPGMVVQCRLPSISRDKLKNINHFINNGIVILLT